MHAIHDLREMLCAELAEYGKKDHLNQTELDIVDKLAHATKNLDKILAVEDGCTMDEYSASRGRMNAKRDSMGRYSSRMYPGNSAIDEIRSMMDEEHDENKRRRYYNILQNLEQ